MQFKKAKVDKRIKVILLDIDMSGAGWGKSKKFATRSPTFAPRANRSMPTWNTA